jgi:hypothetical protein
MWMLTDPRRFEHLGLPRAALLGVVPLFDQYTMTAGQCLVEDDDRFFFLTRGKLQLCGEPSIIHDMTQLVKRAPPHNNSFIIGRSQSRRCNFDEILTAR